MSYEIVYDRLAIKAGEDKYILLIQAGSNNCWEDSRRPEKNWWVYTMDTLGGKSDDILFATEQEIAAQIEADAQKFAGESGYLEIYKTRNKAWTANGFVRWIKNAVKKAVTVEELRERNYLCLSTEYCKNGRDGSDGFKSSDVVSIHTTEDLVEYIKGFQEDAKAIRIWWDLPRDLSRPKVARKPHVFEQVDHYYIIQCREITSRHLYKKTPRGICTCYAEDAKKFKSEKQCLAYIKKHRLNERDFGGHHFDIVRRVDEAACI